MALATFFSILSALFTRLMFCVHVIVTVWRVVVVYEDNLYWYMTLGLVFLLIETLVTLIKRKGQEWKWVCPSFLIYLFCAVPGIWLLELDKFKERRNALLNNETVIFAEEQQNLTIGGLNLSIELDADTWTLVLEQILLLLLIIGRWMLPKGEISRDELSQLLFVYIGMASDIIDFSTLFEEDSILDDKGLAYSVLVFWGISLLQYSIVQTSKKARKSIASDLPSTRQIAAIKEKDKESSTCACLETEIWAILTTLSMQDAPFLVLRLYTIIVYSVFNYTILFFTCKNALILVLQFYRIVVIVNGMKNKVDDIENNPDYINSFEDNNIHVESTTIQDAEKNEYALAVKSPKKGNEVNPIVIKIQLI